MHMLKGRVERDQLTVHVEEALDAAVATLEAISEAKGTKALEGATLQDVLNVESRIAESTIFAPGEHRLLKELAKRFDQIIENATTYYEVHDDLCDTTPPQVAWFVNVDGLAARELRDCLRELSARLATVENFTTAEQIAEQIRIDLT
ncbi:hypothetical protein ACGYKB_17090 [Sulfitobacter sp. 916]|uniref:hypothetical protein n=1 Tax=Sulfitobacter sp. 916 TaxID=3368559 RepID=UPI003745BE2E